ncbi:Peptidase M23 [Geobacter metallireducens RCH3]|uniref:Zinc metalloendopeptidase, M23 family n=1 Tax=Geobacter metallireducens (strain ATCC 53774 / DSM 7210 / GS-15) TaxID=269799 RepID=Q39R97_GEOMG|nr:MULTISPECIES: M23 family metallopeptidase [Geobacter]ABB33227.1 zinc metalloendopeptidase, M23 family [Geobacter metallireducens GS-15]EHP84661.1 Peptidase M23 [Geobacter metallireducens RCH3]MBT1074916.1 M23 family metallopeptidase [Geobacter grbiciae]
MKLIISAILFLLLLPAFAAASRQLPVDGGTVTSGIGWRLDPFGSGRMTYHQGVDIAVPEGTPVYPTQRGTVTFAGPYKGYGNLVAVDHGNGYVTLYGHNSTIRVTPGQAVDTKTVLALAGSTGRSTGPHVHYEVRQIPGYDKKARERLEEQLKALVAEKVNGWVEEYVAKGEGDEGGNPEEPRQHPLAGLALPGGEELP